MSFSARMVFAFFSVAIVVIFGAGYLNAIMQPAPSPVPAEVVQAQASTEKTTDVHSIYGDMNASINETTQGSGNTIYSITTQNIKEKGEVVKILDTAYPAGTKLTLPANTWSPGSNYIYLKEDTSSSSSFLVFRASGEPFSNGEDYLNASKIFEEKKGSEFTLKDITGWDSDSLLHVKAQDASGKSANFWLEIPSGAVIRLSH